MNTIKKILWTLICSMLVISACSGLSTQPTPTVESLQNEEVKPLVSATGKVIPSQWSRLSINVLGVVEEILVQEGEQVQKNQVLLRLKGKEDLQAAIETAKFEVSTAQKALDDLYQNAETTRAAAMEAIATRQKQYRDALYQLDNFTVPQPQSAMSADEALVAMKEKLDQARAAFEPYKYYPSTDDTRENLKEDLDAAQADYNAAVKRLEYETELAVAESNLEKAKQDYQAWKDGPDPKEVTVAQARLDNANATLAAAESKLGDLELRAPFSGTVSEINVRAGEWVTPEIPIFLIADLTNLQVETTDLNEIDAARVRVGDAVRLTFDALPGVEVEGKVKSIAPKAAEGSGVNYTAVIVMDEIPEALRWGMTAFADITVLSE
jgi:multidrug efflux pump subunit AcrA (membrane-fusion protein)